MSSKRLKVSHGDSGISLCSSPSEEVPSATLKDLPNDLLKHCLSFIPGSYVTIAPVSRQFFSNYVTLGIHESAALNSPDELLKVGKNKRTTGDAVSNDIKLTEYAFINNAPKEFMIQVCRKAAANIRIDILECASIFGIEFSEMIGEDIVLMEKLAKRGNLEIIQYFDSKISGRFDKNTWIDIFQGALCSNSNCLHVMKWIFQEKFDDLIEDDIIINNIKSFIEGVEHVLKGVTAPRMTIYLCAIDNEDKQQALVILKWLHHHGCRWDEEFCDSAVLRDNIEALKWARKKGCPWDQRALTAAVENGNVPIIEYCLQNQCPMTEEVCNDAMSVENHNVALDVLKLLRKYSCPWNESICSDAISGGHFEAMLWAKRNGCPWSEEDFFLLVQKGDMSTLETVLEDEPQHDADKTFTALLSDHLSNVPCIIEKLKLLRKYGYSGIQTQAQKLQIITNFEYYNGFGT
ncbi:hypothetical protein CTEN210_04106 [Chaetoceros tenuissimus]|uniref:Uncharacterized protein n=1 Tax=Chaetoceros tenuissimus TaxID=426638 RepID=A0AAD3CMH6_9STRA|nr:hypothetical protein CTEN210_04106 [Chaetoceros tenuissimus]